MDLDPVELIEPVRQIAQAAGSAILTIYYEGFTVTEKADQSPVTEADLAAQERIAQGLAELTPNVPILSEEAEPVPFAERRHWPWLWLIDPLDGTREFIRRNDEFCVNIALIYRHEAVLGLIYLPVSGISYFAYRQGGAFKQLPDQLPRAIRSRRVNPRCIGVAGSRAAYPGSRLQSYLNYLGEHHYLSVGSALKSCLVAEGEVDLYPRFGPTCEWDTAAAQIIVEEAGGRLTDTAMQALRYNARPTLVNPDFFVFGDPGQNWSRYLRSDSTSAPHALRTL